MRFSSQLLFAVSLQLWAFTTKAQNCPSLDFDTDSNGSPTLAGDNAANIYSGYGVTISADQNGPVIFDTANPTGGDTDLATSTEGNVLIIQEKGTDVPDDNWFGGYIDFTFDTPVTIKGLGFLDTEENGNTVQFFDVNDDEITEVDIPKTSDGGQASLVLDQPGVMRMRINFTGSGAVTAVDFCEPGGGSGGDPHFKTWRGEMYDYMGACDLHLVKAPFFAPDLPLTIDVRTKIQFSYSYIDAVVVQIGEETLEVGGWGVYYMNGVEGAKTDDFDIPNLSDFPVTHTKDVMDKIHRFEIQISPQETIVVKTFKHMVSVMVDNAKLNRFHGSYGMMGEFGTGRMLARDGKTLIEDPDMFANEWQVKQDEPRLFDSAGDGPQHPQACQLPETTTAETSRRLGESIALEAAEKACANWAKDMKAACVHDVMSTGDLEFAAAGAF